MTAVKNARYSPGGSRDESVTAAQPRQLIVTIFGLYAREESPMTPEEIAVDYDLPLESVREAIAYCESNPPELKEDYAREEAVMEATGMNARAMTASPKC